jgi:hypothetical protein
MYFYWQYHNIPKGIILGVIFPNNQSVTFLPNVEVLKSIETDITVFKGNFQKILILIDASFKQQT